MRRPEAHRTGDLGEIRAAQLFTESGWIVTNIQPDYGFDLMIRRAEGQIVTNDFALVQVKATRKPTQRPNGGVASITLAREHLNLWQSSPIPTFLVLVVLPANDVFLLDCHALLAQLTQLQQGRECTSGRQKIIFPEATRATTERMTEVSLSVTTFWSHLRQEKALGKMVFASNALVATPVITGVAAGAAIGFVLTGPIGSILGSQAGTRAGLNVMLHTELSGLVGATLAHQIARGALCAVA